MSVGASIACEACHELARVTCWRDCRWLRSGKLRWHSCLQSPKLVVKEVRYGHRLWHQRKPLRLADMHSMAGTPTVLHVSMAERSSFLSFPRQWFSGTSWEPVPEVVLDMTRNGVLELQIQNLPVHTLVLQGCFLSWLHQAPGFPRSTRVLKLWHCGANALKRLVMEGIRSLPGDQHAWPLRGTPVVVACAWLLGLARSL